MSVDLFDGRNNPRQETRCLERLMHLIQALARPLNDEEVVQALFEELPTLIEADRIGVAKSDPAQVWIWPMRKNHGKRDMLRSRLLACVEQMSGGKTSSRSAIRLIDRRPLRLVPAPDEPTPCQEGGAVVHEVGLLVDQPGAGLLHVERAPDRPFSENELRMIDAVAAVLALAMSNAGARKRIEEATLRDSLTGLFNRRALDGLLQRALTAGVRYGVPACLLLLDLDYFKIVNERLGHVAGDGLLKSVATLLKETVREVDCVGRYGGEKFAVVLPHTDLPQAQALAERIRAEIERHAFEIEEGHVRMTASLGVAAIQNSTIESVEQWSAAADSALHEAKSCGRNCVVAHAASPLAPAPAALSLAA